MNAQSNSWTQKASIPGIGRGGSMGFSINGSGYVVCGLTTGGNTISDLWKWNQANNSWTQKANLPGNARHSGVAFKIGNKGYLTTGIASGNVLLNDLWEYNPATNAWIQKLNFIGTSRYYASSFVVGNYAYSGTGFGPGYQKDLWRYDQSNNTWTQMADLPGVGRYCSIGFAINSYGYLVCGYTGVSQKELWRYNTTSNNWSLRTEFPGTARYAPCAFVLNGKAYVGTGTASTGNTKDFYCYDPVLDSWSPAPSLPSNERLSATGFTINGKGYVSCGLNSTSFYNDLWEFNPGALSAYVNGTNLTCLGQNNGTATSMVTGGVSPFTYLWSNGQTTGFISNLASGIYTVTVTDANSISVTASITLTSPNSMSASTPLVSSICKGENATLSVTVSGGNLPYTYSWTPSNLTTQIVQVTPSASTTYTITVHDANGCSVSRTVWVAVNPLPSAPIHVSNGGVACSPDSVKLYSSSNSTLSWQWFRNGTIINGAVDSVYYAKTTGTYKVIVTNAGGCSKGSSNSSVNITQLTATISPLGTVTMCQGDSVNLTANPTSGYNFQWRKNGINISGATQSGYKAKQAGTFKVLITNQINGCTGLSAGTSVVINCRNSSGQFPDQVFPNPSADQFILDLSSYPEGKYIEMDVIDLTGKSVRHFSINCSNSNFSFGRDLSPGMYFIKLKTPSGSQMIKIIKE